MVASGSVLSVLDVIFKIKEMELDITMDSVPLEELEDRVDAQKKPLSLSEALSGAGSKLIAEFKRWSPVAHAVWPDANPVDVARIYSSEGAAAISVLTDSRFMGQLEHIVRIKAAGTSQHCPILRKDFIFDKYQVYEARVAGADALLLIVAMLSRSKLTELLHVSDSLSMQCLVEVHNREELQIAIDAGAEIIGINNRNLHDYETNLSVTEDLAPLITGGQIIVSESGISTRADVQRMGRAGAHAMLVGTGLMRADNVAEKVRELINDAVPCG